MLILPAGLPSAPLAPRPAMNPPGRLDMSLIGPESSMCMCGLPRPQCGKCGMGSATRISAPSAIKAAGATVKRKAEELALPDDSDEEVVDPEADVVPFCSLCNCEPFRTLTFAFEDL